MKRIGLRVAVILVLTFLYVPLLVIALFAFSTDGGRFEFPPPSLTLKWFADAAGDETIWEALWLSVRVGLGATAVALVLGSLAAAAISRAKFFGREAVSFALVLPIALPGIVTGIALRSAVDVSGVSFSTWTIAVGHATFCVVVVYNNVLARLRRTSSSLVEASMDLGATGLQTFRHITLPTIGTALLAGGMLAFALSFDEIIVTTFTAGTQKTLPIWIFDSLSRPRNRPVTNVVALGVIVLTFIPILLAQRLTRETGGVGVS